MRVQRGISVEKAAEALECSVSKISRLETGVGVPRARDVRDLIDAIGGEAEDRRDELMALAEEARAQAWYYDYGDLLDDKSTLKRFIDLESGASEELVFGGAWVPGLLQTPEYAEAVYRVLQPEADIRRLVDLRMRRKAVLTARKPRLELHAVVDESVLLRSVGGPEVMRGQLEALQAAATVPDGGNVAVRVLPFSVGMHELLAGDLTVLRFDGDDEDVVLAEGHVADGIEERKDEVARTVTMFRSAWDLAVGGAELAGRLTSVIEASPWVSPPVHAPVR
jgi:transcriptional regulator with XRE-family HTH domain